MDATNWQKQTRQAPLFPDLLWSRPENRRHAGKLLILGGNGHGFAAPAAAYAEAGKAGIGTCRVVLPDALHKTVSSMFPAADYAASTATSGGFARAALAEWLDQSAWADGVLLAGDLGHNSETAMLLESYLDKYGGQLSLVGDAIDYCLDTPELCLTRPDTTLGMSAGQLQKFMMAAKWPTAVTSTMALLQLVETLQAFTRQYPLNIMTVHDQHVVVAAAGQVSSTTVAASNLTSLVSHAAVWWLQNPSQAYEALTTSIVGD